VSSAATQTSKNILTNREAIKLAERLREECRMSMVLEHALFTNATPTLIDTLESLIGVCRALRSEKMSDEDKRIRKYLLDSVRKGDYKFK